MNCCKSGNAQHERSAMEASCVCWVFYVRWAKIYDMIKIWQRPWRMVREAEEIVVFSLKRGCSAQFFFFVNYKHVRGEKPRLRKCLYEIGLYSSHRVFSQLVIIVGGFNTLWMEPPLGLVVLGVIEKDSCRTSQIMGYKLYDEVKPFLRLLLAIVFYHSERIPSWERGTDNLFINFIVFYIWLGTTITVTKCWRDSYDGLTHIHLDT